MIRIEKNQPNDAVIKEAVRIIRNGGIVLYPADTIYGLGCDPFNTQALARIIRLKGRPERKGMLLLISNLQWVEKLATKVSTEAMDFCRNIWPGPVTVLLNASKLLPDYISGDLNKVGLRIPDSKFLQSWLDQLENPIVSTSANLSGHAPSRVLADLVQSFGSEVDLFLESGDLPESVPSSVIDFTSSHPVVVRKGAGMNRIIRLLGVQN